MVGDENASVSSPIEVGERASTAGCAPRPP
jgi:hypothetical protein